jgi:hypothetical protein
LDDLRNDVSFLKAYNNLTEILTDRKLAALGDTLVNFIYSLALSRKRGQPSGAKVRGAILREAIRRVGLRGFMPTRVSGHMMADAAEALIAYAWLKKHITLEECVTILAKNENLVDGFVELLSKVMERITF